MIYGQSHLRDELCTTPHLKSYRSSAPLLSERADVRRNRRFNQFRLFTFSGFFSLLVRDPACFFHGGDFRQCIFALKTRIILRVLLLLKPKFKLYFFYNFFFNNFILKI